MYAQLNASLRDMAVPAKHIRKLQLVPASIFGKGMAPQSLQFSLVELTKSLSEDHAIFEINIDGKKTLASPQEIQREPVSRKIVHVAFHCVNKDEVSEFVIHLAVSGEAPGTKVGGVVIQTLNEIHIKCKPKDAPDRISIDVSNLNINQHLTLADIKLPKNVSLVSKKLDDTIVTCHAPKITSEVADTTEVEPEVVGKELPVADKKVEVDKK